MKLTNAMRSTIAARLVAKTRVARDIKFRNQEHSLTLRLIRTRYGGDVFERCRALPEGWLQVHKAITLENKFAHKLTACVPSIEYRYLGRRRNEEVLGFRTLNSLSLSEYAPLPASAGNTWESEFLDPFFDELEEHARARRSHELDIHSLATQTRGILTSYNTVELLSKDWPEGYALLPPELIAPALPPGVPAVRIADLNLKIERIREAA